VTALETRKKAEAGGSIYAQTVHLRGSINDKRERSPAATLPSALYNDNKCTENMDTGSALIISATSSSCLFCQKKTISTCIKQQAISAQVNLVINRA
jgi:hypothetical protein